MKHHILLSILMIIALYSCGTVNAQKETTSCIDLKIEEFKNQPVANPPIGIYQYTYNDAIVNYVSAPCCDRYTTLYDENCTIICRPSGGITGKGDGKCRDFFEKRTNEKRIWLDSRTHK